MVRRPFILTQGGQSPFSLSFSAVLHREPSQTWMDRASLGQPNRALGRGTSQQRGNTPSPVDDDAVESEEPFRPSLKHLILSSGIAAGLLSRKKAISSQNRSLLGAWLLG